MSGSAETSTTSTTRSFPRWLPALLLGAALLGGVAVFISILVDERARDWSSNARLGGSTLYALNVGFARLIPFLAGAGVALALLQRQRRVRERDAGGDSVRRHELTEVVTHWLNAIGIGIGLITAAWLLTWLGNPLSLEATYLLHFVGAGFTLAAVAHHIAFHLAGGGAGLIPRSGSDLKNAVAETVGYTGVYRGLRGAFGIQLPRFVRQPLGRVLRALRIVPDPAGKFLSTEKVLSYPVWAVLIGVVVVTGVIKSVHYIYALPGGFRQTMTFLHDGATIFLIVFLAVHVGALVLVPRNWPLLKSMFTTRISRRYAEQHLPAWKLDEGAAPEREREEEHSAN